MNGGTIDTGAKTDTITGVIGGTGQFTKLGTGTLVLGGDNTFTGDLHVNAGTLQISDNSNLGNPIVTFMSTMRHCGLAIPSP
ncbi:hypothetical protein HGG76_20695 [Ochrobactrum tritici]|uniref:Outer membrane autotransporter n=1 Tax=Brucella tritici TaxID=94626 RepID=A0A7X6JDQ5_9HYPH|nr:hypothetical protein [Brucella tritici]